MHTWIFYTPLLRKSYKLQQVLHYKCIYRSMSISIPYTTKCDNRCVH